MISLKYLSMKQKLWDIRNNSGDIRITELTRFSSGHTNTRSHGVMVSTPDSESGNPSSNLGGTLLYFMFVLKWRIQIHIAKLKAESVFSRSIQATTRLSSAVRNKIALIWRKSRRLRGGNRPLMGKFSIYRSWRLNHSSYWLSSGRFLFKEWSLLSRPIESLVPTSSKIGSFPSKSKSLVWTCAKPAQFSLWLLEPDGRTSL